MGDREMARGRGSEPPASAFGGQDTEVMAVGSNTSLSCRLIIISCLRSCSFVAMATDRQRAIGFAVLPNT